MMFQNAVSSKFNNFDVNIAQLHLFWSYAAIQSNFDIDSCNFYIDRGIDILPFQVKLMFFTIHGIEYKNAINHSSKHLSFH